MNEIMSCSENSHLADILSHEQYLMVYPISQGKIINFVAFIDRHDLENTRFNGSWVSVAEQDEFPGPFAHWEAEPQALLDVSGFSSGR